MLVFNIDLAEQVFEAARPRAPREIMIERYPNAVEDADGRFHAPCDGYVSAHNEHEYRGGEYLPESDDCTSRPARITATLLNGMEKTWVGSKGQIDAVFKELCRQSNEHDAARSTHIGSIGDKVELLAVDIAWTKVYGGYYGNVYITKMYHDGDVVIYKGSKLLGEKGDIVYLTAKIKDHNVRDGVPQTIIERPKIK